MRIQELFNDTQVELKISDDVIGTAALGVMKNVYVLGLGLSDGLGLGDEFKKKLVALARLEMEQMLEKLGAKKETIDTPAGMGDFLATGYSSSSRNYQYGFGFAKGEIKDNLTAEGIKNIQNLSIRLSDISDLSFFNAIKSIFINNADPRSALTSVIK
jgi:glycerol-3-phosphate dehydrogenase (NAD(P)+)